MWNSTILSSLVSLLLVLCLVHNTIFTSVDGFVRTATAFHRATSIKPTSLLLPVFASSKPQDPPLSTLVNLPNFTLAHTQEVVIQLE
jgi:hypothetical protein